MKAELLLHYCLALKTGIPMGGVSPFEGFAFLPLP